MRSNDHSERLDLERGQPTTEHDVVALRKLRHPSMTDAEYVRFLKMLAAPGHAALAAKPGPRGEIFRLPQP
jgi:hypothetical protein